MTPWLKDNIRLHTEGFRNSYTQVFFSDHVWFATILIAVSFIDIYAGLSGALSVGISNLLAHSMGFNKWLIRKGYYGYNSLLTGLGFGLTFHPGLPFFLLIPVAALLTFLFTVAFQGFFYKYALPYLSIPFLLGIWIILLASDQFSALGLSARGIYTFNELYAIGGKWLIDAVEWFDKLVVNNALRTFLYSLGAIFFQQNLLAGVLIALGILIYSRIAFSLSVAGFLMAWIFYRITGADITSLGYSYIGFNYILTSIALGGFFIIPSKWSYLWLLWLLPLLIVVTVGLQQLFSLFRLGVYALPFNIVVITFLYVLKIREKPGKRLVETPVQHFSPEKNLYNLRINTDRFYSPEYQPVSLPVMGEWKISQGYNGDITHKGEWTHGLDLVMTDGKGNLFRENGVFLKDYYCFEKPVVAAADGTVADTTDGIDDNLPGDINVRQNWGNSVVLQHGSHLFSQVSHLKQGTVRVKKGESVKKGDILGLCGNSGRSPYPHLHFQVQQTPHIGSRTIFYPLSAYLSGQQGDYTLHTHSVPQTGQNLTAVRNHALLENAFRFLPGQVFTFEVSGSETTWLKGTHVWEVKTDEYNNSYLECNRTGAQAYFYNNGNMHYFINYLGNRASLLYYFYLGLYGVLTGFYQGLVINDVFPPDKLYPGLKLFFQDFLSPFHIYLKPEYKINYLQMEEDFYSSKAVLETTIGDKGKVMATIRISLTHQGISGFAYLSEKLNFSAICTGSF